MMTSPFTAPLAYSTIRLDGIEWIFTIRWGKEADSPRKWDQVAGQGTSGATVKYNGDGLAEFQILFCCAHQVHFDFFDTRFRPLLRRPKDKEKPVARTVEHPDLAKLEITRCVVTNVGICKELEPGLWAYPVSFLQFRAPKPVQTLKAAGAPEGAGGDPAKPPTPREVEINRMNLWNNQLATWKPGDPPP